jgi:hypothetical protein
VNTELSHAIDSGNLIGRPFCLAQSGRNIQPGIQVLFTLPFNAALRRFRNSHMTKRVRDKLNPRGQPPEKSKNDL